MAVEINIPKPIIDYNDLENKPNLVTAHSELNLDDGTNPHGTTAIDVGALAIPTGTTAEYLRGDGSVATFPTIPDPANFVAKSDYSPAHSVLVQQSGTGSPTSVQIGNNEFLGRKSGGGADIEGLSVSEAKAMLDLSNTNTGDETQSSILAKLGMFRLYFTTSSVVTGTTSETQVGVIEIPAGSIKNVDSLRIYAPMIKSINAGNGTYLTRMKLSTSSSMPLLTTNVIALYNAPANNAFVPFLRNPSYNGGNLILSSSGFVTDLVISTANPSIISYNNNQTLYLYISVTLSNPNDGVYLSGGYIKNL
jgi:hypothetical protein